MVTEFVLEKRQFVSLNSLVFIENLSSSERAPTSARANHAKIDVQKGCAMQLNGITLKENAIFFLVKELQTQRLCMIMREIMTLRFMGVKCKNLKFKKCPDPHVCSYFVVLNALLNVSYVLSPTRAPSNYNHVCKQEFSVFKQQKFHFCFRLSLPNFVAFFF